LFLIFVFRQSKLHLLGSNATLQINYI